MKIKTIGYIIAFIGILGIVLSSQVVLDIIPFLKNVSTNYVLIPSIVLTAFGILILIIAGKKGNNKQEKEEVPIYKGKKIIGYRREK
jgi:ABC-type long-subunit fatty acid transport system fused permease/ATPase subunit